MKEYIIDTPCGRVRGTQGKKEGIAVYKGIRYARAERWQYPEKVTHWDGIYDAGEFGACSYQPRAFYDEAAQPGKAFYYKEFREGETYTYHDDCLFLNIWAPENAKKAPVIVYIHGGGFLGGCGHEKHFDCTAWCEKGVIGVTLNYRLGPMGFMCLPELASEAGHTGNYGLYDQLAALEWVHDNIEAFGGDPENITLMGQSAGAMSVQMHCVSPLSDHLFARAVMMSGGGISEFFNNPPIPEQTYTFWAEVMRETGAKGLEDLRAMDAEVLFAAFSKQAAVQKNPMLLCSPVIDGAMLPETPSAAAKQHHQKEIPYLMGSTSEDIVPPFMHKMAKGWARMQADQKGKASYTYFFCRQLPGDEAGAWHSSDLWYMFGSLQNGWRPFTEWDAALSDAMTSYLTNFARTGDPNGEQLPVWEPTEKGQPLVMRFDDSEIRMGGVSVAKLMRTMKTKQPVGE